MNRTFKVSIAAVLLGTAALAVAVTQSPAESFADRIRRDAAATNTRSSME
jgi:hypothetical protein